MPPPITINPYWYFHGSTLHFLLRRPKEKENVLLIFNGLSTLFHLSYRSNTSKEIVSLWRQFIQSSAVENLIWKWKTLNNTETFWPMKIVKCAPYSARQFNWPIPYHIDSWSRICWESLNVLADISQVSKRFISMDLECSGWVWLTVTLTFSWNLVSFFCAIWGFVSW